MGELAKPRVLEDDLPYRGQVGRTRSEAVQVLMPDGGIRSLAAYVGVDAVADPALAALARAGTLHQVAEGVDLALAFVYHDPLERLFVLVIPEGLRHRALALRAELMLAIASDGHHAVPDYVRDVEVVVGAHGLARRLTPGREVTEAAARRAFAERELELSLRERLLEVRERALGASTPSILHAVRDSDVEEIDDLEYEPANVALADVDDDVSPPTLADDDELEEVEEIEGGEAVIDGDDEPFYEALPVEEVAAVLLDVAPPDAFTIDPAQQLCLSEAEGKVWLFVRGRPLARHGDGELELLLQLDPTARVPVVLITLVFDVSGSPEVRRGVVDPFVAEQTRALYLLAQHFEVELVAVSAQGLEHFATLQSPRERNVRALIAQLERQGVIDREGWFVARDGVLASPPPWRDRAHPFQGASALEVPRTVTEAAVLLDELSEWLSPERQARLKLALCVPDEVTDATYREGIAHALDWGLSLTRELAARALELGIEKDEGSLLARRIAGLCRTSREADFGGLEQGVLRAEWSEALEQAARLGVGLSDEARERALEHAGERALVHANALGESHDPALDPAREKAAADPPDVAALEELLARGGHRDVLTACRVAHKLAPEVAGKLFAQLARRGDPVALDALLSLLAASEPVLVRAGAGLALAARRALNALDDLVLQVASEPEPTWALFAQALGRYGAGSFRAITAALRRHGVAQDRVALVYAHLALHGARAQVRAKARAHELRDAQLAERALALASELKDGKKPATGLEQQGSLTVFSETFDRLCRDTVG
ncbi:MAG: hypothetical protein ABW252_09085 [Polyangiales bacterium]